MRSLIVGLSAVGRMRVQAPRSWLGGLIAGLGLMLPVQLAVEAQAVEYKLCAFRAGPDGPCSCQVKGDLAGQFTNVDENNCGRRPLDAEYEDEEYIAPSYAPKGPIPSPAKAPRPQLAGSEAAPGDSSATSGVVKTTADDNTAAADSIKTSADDSSPSSATPQNSGAADEPSVTSEQLDTAEQTLAAESAAASKKDAAADEAAMPEKPVAAEKPAASGKETAVATEAKQSTLKKVRDRGVLNCGVNTELLGFSALSGVGEWQGIDVDFCRAVAIAVLGSSDKVAFLPLGADERFTALQQGRIDLLSRNTTWTMSRVIELGVEFAGVSYFDGQGFLTRHDRGLVSAQQLDGLKVCVQSGTTSEANLDYYLKNLEINAEKIVFVNKAELLAAYEAGACDAYTADRSALLSDRAGLAAPDTHEVLPETISKEPLGPVVRQDDREWIEIVRWTLAGLINAEEVRLTREKASAEGDLDGDMKRLVDGAGQSGKRLGLADNWLRLVVSGVGNYGEVFEANIGNSSPIGMDRGMNALWKRGGLLFAPPMW